LSTKVHVPAARVAVRKVLPPFSTLVDPDGIEEDKELAHEVRLSSADSYPMPQLSEKDQSVASDVKRSDDPADLEPLPDDNTARDSQNDEPRGLNFHDGQLETISGDFCVDSPVQDNDSDPKV
jgi:hypothetical protein